MRVEGVGSRYVTYSITKMLCGVASPRMKGLTTASTGSLLPLLPNRTVSRTRLEHYVSKSTDDDHNIHRFPYKIVSLSLVNKRRLPVRHRPSCLHPFEPEL